MDVWTCCQCKATNLIALATKCPLCAHTRCDNCRRGPPSRNDPAPLQSRHISHASPVSSSHQPAYPSSPPHTTIPSHTGHSYSSPVSHSSSAPPLSSFRCDHHPGHPSSTAFSRPSMAGWWICCHCQNHNNPKLSGGRCLCSHYRCTYCKDA